MIQQQHREIDVVIKKLYFTDNIFVAMEDKFFTEVLRKLVQIFVLVDPTVNFHFAIDIDKTINIVL